MAQLTKSQLIEQLSAERHNNEQLNNTIARLQGELAAARKKLHEAELDASAVSLTVDHELGIPGAWANAESTEAYRAQLRTAFAALKAAKPASTARVSTYVPRGPSPEQLARREAMARAKAEAMATGRSVRVEV